MTPPPSYTPWLAHLRNPTAHHLNWFNSIFTWLHQHNYNLDDPTSLHSGHALLFSNDISFVILSHHITFTTRPTEPGMTVHSQDESWEASIGYRSHLTTALFLLNSLQHNPNHN